MQKDVKQIPADPRAKANQDWEQVADRHFWRQFPRYMAIAPHLYGRVLDIGGGVGYLAPFCQPNAAVYTCLDISDKAIQMGAKLFPGSTFIQHDAEKKRLPFEDRSFDTVVCADTIEHMEDHSVVIPEMRRVCRYQVVITVPISMGGVGHIWPVWTQQDVLDKFKCLGKAIELRTCYEYHFHLFVARV